MSWAVKNDASIGVVRRSFGWRRSLAQEKNTTVPPTLRTARIIIVEPVDANAIALSLHDDETIILDQVGRFVDGVAVEE
ncbi:hypothetical protein Tco_0691178, partial [Tanacetum coccineum]